MFQALMVLFFFGASIIDTYAENSFDESPFQNVQKSLLQPTHHFVTAPDGVEIHYVTMGQGTPIMFIHGAGANAYLNWFINGIAEEMAQTNQVVAIDVRGHGESERSYRNRFYSEKNWKDVLLVLDDQKIGQAHFHGYSMGGSILAQIMLHHPERILTATFGGMGFPETESEFIGKVPQDTAATDQAKKIEQKAIAFVRKHTKKNNWPLFTINRNPPLNSDLLRKMDLESIIFPVLALNGEYDSPHKKTTRMKRQIKNFTGHIIKDRSHVSVVTNGFMDPIYTTHFARFIRDFDENVKSGIR